MGEALARHDGILRIAVGSNTGQIVKTTGDGVHAVFTSARDGAECTIDAQRGLHAVDWGGPGPLKVRMVLHTGEAELREGDYYGTAVNRAARIMACGHGGQILMSSTTAQLLEDALPDDVTLTDLGEHRLRDLARPERVFQLNAPGCRTSSPTCARSTHTPRTFPRSERASSDATRTSTRWPPRCATAGW
jgi:class 3 adenylate cyclase